MSNGLEMDDEVEYGLKHSDVNEFNYKIKIDVKRILSNICILSLLFSWSIFEHIG